MTFTERKHHAALRAAVEAMAAELETYRDSCASKADRIDRLGETNARLSQELEAAKSEIERLNHKDKLITKWTENGELIERLYSAGIQQERELAAMQAKLMATDTTVGLLEQELEAAKSEIARTQHIALLAIADTKTLQAKLDALEKQEPVLWAIQTKAHKVEPTDEARRLEEIMNASLLGVGAVTKMQMLSAQQSAPAAPKEPLVVPFETSLPYERNTS
jgi:chromosome segregation ATPase